MMAYGNDLVYIVAATSAPDLQEEINNIIQAARLEITGVSLTSLGESVVAIVSVRTPI